MVALARLLGERWIGEASFRLRLEAQSLPQEACERAHMGGAFYAKGVKVELGVGEGLLHGYSAEFPFIPQLVVEEKEMNICVDSKAQMVQYKYTTYLVSMPDVPDFAIHIGIGYIGGGKGAAGLGAFVPVYVGVPMAVVGAAIEDLLHDLGVGDAAFGLVWVFAWAEPADGCETGCGGVFSAHESSS